MPDKDTNESAESAIPQTSLHAYGEGRAEGDEGRREDVEGDVDKLTSDDPKRLQQREVGRDEDDSFSNAPPKA